LYTLSKKGKLIMRKLFTLLVATLLLAAGTNAQKISGVVKDQQGTSLEKATVSLLRAKDSSVVKLSVTGSDGRFSFTTDPGNYLVNVSHIGHDLLYSKPFEASTTAANDLSLVMTKTATNLGGVTVSSKKPLVEVRADKMIVNVEGTINATGNDALELLRRSPGVTVDKDDNISLAGKNGVQVYIDGKPSPLSGQDLANYLKTLQAAQIEAIELITNPSAKYEAAGNAGIINIKLKKNKAFGTNGSVNAGYNIGSFPKYNGGFALNHRNKSVNLFGNYNYNYGTNAMSFIMRREQFDSLFLQTNRMRFTNNSHGFKAGVDYFIDNNSTIGAMVNGNLAINDFRSQGPMEIYRPDGQLDRVLHAASRNDMKRDNLNGNINYRYAKTGGTELNIDADYGYFTIRSDQWQPNIYRTPAGQDISSSIYNMIAPTDIDLYSVKADYEQNFKGGRLGLGGKVGFVNTDNNFQRFNSFGNTKVMDTLKSNLFEYRENINAVYANYNKAFKGFMIQFGVRMENTHSKGTSIGYKENNNGDLVPFDSTFDRNYTDFFPSAALTFNKNPMSQWNFTYSRRIDRPAYQDLNPFEFKLNEYTFMKGNTALRPQYTHSIGVTHTYKYRLNTTLNYSHVSDIFTQLPDTTEKTKAFLIKKNLATQDVVSLNISYPFQYKWYSFFANGNVNYSLYKADFGGGDRKVNQDVITFSYFMQNTANLGKGWTAELSGFYNSPSLWQGIFKSKAMYSVDGGLMKTLFKNKATVKVSVSDMFRTMRWAGSSTFSGAYSYASGRWESRQFKINFNWRFGSNTVKAARQRGTGIDDESKRANQSGGQGGIGQ
jgi:iron complex outermembrane recepter protein